MVLCDVTIYQKCGHYISDNPKHVFEPHNLVLQPHVEHHTHVYTPCAGARSEFRKRAHHISDHQKHVFEPLMKRCLEERPSARGTFEDALVDIQVYLKKYAKNRQVETLEGNKVRLVFRSFV